MMEAEDPTLDVPVTGSGADAAGAMLAASATPSRAAFLSTGTADFHPPDWACMPLEANLHARLEALRDSRHCATYMVSTKLVNVFGRDQDACDHVLGNPSISRKHAAVIHDSAGGIYLVDLMSRHGTYVKGKKIPPHDPFLLHEGDTIKFGQSIRVYILKGASPEGASAPVKKTWGKVKIKAPKVSISAVLPKMTAKPKYSAPVIKLVNDICYGNMADDKLEAFLTAVMELGDDEKREVADLLIEKVYAKFEFYAAHVHRNAYGATAALLKRNMLVSEFEGNLGIITQLSQQRHDSIYRSDARKILQLLAAVRLDPENVQSPIGSYSVNDSDSVVSADDVNACPPTTNHIAGRQRVLSDEGKRLFLAGHGYPQHEVPTRKNTLDGEHDVPHHSRQGSYGSTQYGDDDDARSDNGGYQPPAPWQNNGGYNPPARGHLHGAGSHGGSNGTAHGSAVPQESSAFGFMSKPSTAPPAATAGSAFGFISSGAGSDDEEDAAPTSFGFMNNGQQSSGPPLPRVHAVDFLADSARIDEDEFEVMWESTDETEEWAVELCDDFDQNELQAVLDSSRIKFVTSEKVAGSQRLLYCAEQQAKETKFLVEITLMPGLSDMTVTFKWIVNSLLYENGHELFIELFKYVVHPFCGGDNESNSHRTKSESSMASHASRPTARVHSYEVPSSSHLTDETVGNDDDDEEQWDEIPVLDYLTENAIIDPAKFEQLWAGATEISTISCSLNGLPDKEEVIRLFQHHRLSCLASGAVDHLVKFYFFGEMIELHCMFCMELIIDAQRAAAAGTIKRFAFQALNEDEAQQLDSSFVTFVERAVRQL